MMVGYNANNSNKAAICSDELTCCNARHGTATPGSTTAKFPRISPGVHENEQSIFAVLDVSFGRSP